VEKNRSTRTHNIQSGEAVDECESASIHRLFNLQGNGRIDPLMVLVGINGRNVEMEIDTGAAVSLISRAAFDNLWCEADKPTLRPMSQKLATYTGESITPCGRCQVSVEYNGRQYRLPLVVVPGAGPMLLGRNWLQVVQLSWKRIYQLKSVNATPAIEDIIAKYPDVFKNELGTLKGFTAKLSVDPRTKPIFCKARHVPFALREKVDKELDRLVSEGIVEPVQYSEWAAPIVAVVKTDQSIRLCGDYKMTINKCSNLDQYPIPRIDDLYAKLVGGQKFTKLDLRSAFLQVPLEENSKKYLTINTQRGLYRFNRLSFGVKSAPGIYQRCMDNLLANEPHVVCYQDDILITGSTDSEHLTNLDRVLKKLSESGLRIRLDKCKFMASSVTYLGHWIDSEGLHPTEEKIRAIRDAPAPRNETELKAFLGLFQFYARYVPNVADKLGPLYYLLRKGVSWKWGATQSTAFQRAKDSLQSANVLVHYDPEKELVLTCDASQYGVGAVLSHVLLDGSEKPVAFASRTLSSAEKNYSQLDKEGLSIIFGVKKFHQYLFGRPFRVITDHKPLISLFSPTKPTLDTLPPRIIRWSLLMSAYDYTIEYKPGSRIVTADAMSRIPLQEILDVPTPGCVIHLMDRLNNSMVDSMDIQNYTRKDPVLSKVLQAVQSGGNNIPQDTLYLPFRARQNELSVEGGCLLWGSRVIVPHRLRQQVLEELHQCHPGMVKMKALARNYVWWPGIDSHVEEKVKNCYPCQYSRGLPAKAPLHPWEWPAEPWHRVHVDFADYNGKNLLVITDAHSKWIDVHATTTATSTTTIERLRHCFATHGLPHILVSDNVHKFGICRIHKTERDPTQTC